MPSVRMHSAGSLAQSVWCQAVLAPAMPGAQVRTGERAQGSKRFRCERAWPQGSQQSAARDAGARNHYSAPRRQHTVSSLQRINQDQDFLFALCNSLHNLTSPGLGRGQTRTPV